jgi:hypothetical protein
MNICALRWGIISTFSWWDNVDKDSKTMSLGDIPCGNYNYPYFDLEQG